MSVPPFESATPLAEKGVLQTVRGGSSNLAVPGSEVAGLLLCARAEKGSVSRASSKLLPGFLRGALEQARVGGGEGMGRRLGFSFSR